jgi:Uncharacterized protein conserved in bacteria
MPRRVRRTDTDPFTDLLFNALLGITVLFVVSVLFLHPETKTGIINPKAEYIITVSWKDNDPNDIDTWVESPRGDVVWFRNPESGLIHLDRDDRGLLNDTLTIQGRTVTNPLNQEIVTIRGVVPGEYVVNVHYYATETRESVLVSVKVERVNPALEVVYYGDVTLAGVGDEQTVVRFRIASHGGVEGINFLPKKLVQLI